MRIGMITGEYPPTVGGVGAFTHILAGEMARGSHDVSVFARREARQAVAEDGIQLRTDVVGTWGWKTIGQIRKWIVETRREIVIIQFQTAAFEMHPSIHWVPSALRRFSIPTIVTFHDLRVPYLFPKAGPVREWLVTKLARDATGVICTHVDDFDQLRADSKIQQLRRIPIGSNIAAQELNPADRQVIRRQFEITDDHLLIGYFGFINQSKGVRDLIDALHCLTRQGIDAYVLMIGGNSGGPDRVTSAYHLEVLDQIQSESLQNRVIWTGLIPEDEAGRMLSSCDIITLPFSEGVSLRSGTLMAALAHGKAVVTTTPKSDITELAGAVEFAKSGDGIDLADKIRAIWLNDERRIALELAARETSIRNFTWPEIASRTVSFCQEICSLELVK